MSLLNELPNCKFGINLVGYRLWSVYDEKEKEARMKPFTGTPTDYSLKEHWLAMPDHPDKPVDLVFL